MQEQEALIAELQASQEQAGEAAQLRRQLEHQQALTAQLQSERDQTVEAPDLDVRSYENDLNEFRRQLETDRHALDQELERLQQRKIALDDMGRETEMELSRERAALAQERVQLDRLREEIRSEGEKLQREGDLRERLSAVNRLADRQRGNAVPPAAVKAKETRHGLRRRGPA